MSGRELRRETVAIHSGLEPEVTTGAIQPPIFQTSTYAQSGFAEHKGYEYARTSNPTREALETALAAIEAPDEERTTEAICFSSGMAAISAIVDLLDSGDSILTVDDLYGGTVRFLRDVVSRRGITTQYNPMTEVNQCTSKDVLGEAVKLFDRIGTAATKMLWVETPTNPLLRIHDLEALCNAAKKRGWTTVVDNTFASPILQNPLSCGADLVVHSTTKYVGGHSDVIGGAVITANPVLAERIRFLQKTVGAIPGPWDCFLLLRGLRTLPLRMERHCENASELARRLEAHPKVTSVIYPGLSSHPGHEIATRQMKGFGGMISVEVEGGVEGARRFANKLRIWTIAESLGGFESLLNHPWTMTHASISEEQRIKNGLKPGLMRFSVGLEHVDDLWNDLNQALEAI